MVTVLGARRPAGTRARAPASASYMRAGLRSSGTGWSVEAVVGSGRADRHFLRVDDAPDRWNARLSTRSLGHGLRCPGTRMLRRLWSTAASGSNGRTAWMHRIPCRHDPNIIRVL